MADVQDIVFGVTGQSIYLDVPEGRPSSVTSVKVFAWNTGDDATEEAATTGSASTDAVNTTFDAASGVSQADSRKCSLTATTSIAVGRTYLATTAGGEREWLEVTSITSGDSVQSRVPLANDYGASDAFVGARISIGIDATWVADLANVTDGRDPNPGYRVRWRYVVGGLSYVRYTYLDLVRTAGGHNVRLVDVERLIPGFRDALPRAYRDDGGASLLDEAYAQLTLDLHVLGIPDQLTRNQDVIDDLVKRKAVALWAHARGLLGGGDLDVAAAAERMYQTRFDQFFRAPSSPKVPVGTANTGAGGRVLTAGFTRR